MPQVDFFEISDSRSVLTEAENEMTSIQLAHLFRNIRRLETYGWALDGSYFARVKDAKEKLWEYRLTLDKVEFRFLFADEAGTFVMLVVYKENETPFPQARSVAPKHVSVHGEREMRISEWHEKKIADDPDYAQAVALVSLTQDLADVIVNLRVKLSMSQAELARRAGTTQAVISRLENGDANPTVDMVRRVVNALVETATAQAAAR